MAPRKRKVVVPATGQSPEKIKYSTAVIQTMLKAQPNQTVHAKLIRELKGLYATVAHDSFMKSFLQVIKRQMEHEETNEYANNVFMFCATFVADPEYSEQSETHPVMSSLFDWLLSTISYAPLVRFRICQLVNLVLNALGSDATLDDSICDKILRYMLERMRDVSQHVRVQAVLALQRLQDPTNPEDAVCRAYIYHLDKDPSPKVRQTIISSLGPNYRSLPHIIDRLWDVDERVRRHTYMQMSSFPVRQYKVAQRLKFLEQGLTDHAESVKKVVRNVMIPQWFESYQQDHIVFIEALKLDADEKEIERFRNTAKMTLLEIFKKSGVKEMGALLKFSEESKVVPLADLTIERAICWQALLEHQQTTDTGEEEDYMMELSKLCEYLKQFIENTGNAAFMMSTDGNRTKSALATSTSSSPHTMDKLQQLYFQYILLTLLEIVGMYDYGDEFGRDSLKLVLSGILCNEVLFEMNVRLIMSIFEKLLPDVEQRFKFFVDLVNSVLEPSRVDFSDSSRVLVDKYFERHPEQTGLQFKISSLRLEILDLKEQENSLVQQKDYKGAHLVTEKLLACNEELSNLLKPLAQELSATLASNTSCSSNSTLESGMFQKSTLNPRRMTQETISKCLQICFHLVNSPSVRVLTPMVCDLYKSFISRHVQSSELHTRNWALRASTAFSMLYDGLSKETFQLLYQQFLHTSSTRLWKTAIECVFELLDRYGFEHFDLEDESKDDSRVSKSSRQLFNRHSGHDMEEEVSACNGNEFYKMSIHFMDTCDEPVICKTIIEGFCRLVLHGHCSSTDIVSKLLLRYFNPTTDPETQQILGIFFEGLIRKRRQELMQKALLGTLFTILEASNESPLAEVRPETVLKFVINSTRPIFCNPGVNPHNTIAASFLRVMQDNLSLKELLKLMSRDLLTLEIGDDPTLRADLANAVDEMVRETNLDPKIVKNLTTFRELMRGKIVEPLSFSSSRVPAVFVHGEDSTNGDDQSIGTARSEVIEEDDDEEEDRDEEDEEKRDDSRPNINKSILQEDSDTDLLASPLRSRASLIDPNNLSSPSRPANAQAMSVQSPLTANAENRIEGSTMKSLRRSLHFGGSANTPMLPPATTKRRTPTFKVPDASALHKIRPKPRSIVCGKKNASTNETVPSTGQSFEIPATQETTDDDSSQEASDPEEIPETQPEPNTSVVTSATRGRRNAKSKQPTCNARSSSSSSTSSSEGDVVNASPNASKSRMNRSVVRSLTKVAAKTLFEQKLQSTPSTMPRTRHANRMEALNEKVMTRKSLSEALAAITIGSPSRETRKVVAAKLFPTAEEEQRNKKYTKQPTTIRAEKATASSNDVRRSASARRTFGPGTTPTSKVITETAALKASTTRTTSRKTSSVDAGGSNSSPYGKRSLPKRVPRPARQVPNGPIDVEQTRGNKQTESGASSIESTSSTSPIRLKRAAVVLTPLSATRLALTRSSRKTTANATIPKRSGRKAKRL
ncbi:condensin complex subunit 3-like [Anopheles darlingi]|uniref:condensin complex subunit 3-like n=1 Tax=Anopheles darlingi TaxID=43151 RepID=UPI00210050DA|nr:condensin complex subunit 3-like [Anopheles darlingi]